MARGEWAAAEHNFQEAIRLKPGSSVYSNLGTLYIYAGRYNDAIPVLEQAVQLGGDDRHAYLIWGNLGDAYRWAGGREISAKAAYAMAVELARRQLAVNPKDATLLALIAVWEAKMGELAEAQAGIRLALKSAPADPANLFNAALVLEISGKRSESLKMLGEALRSGYSTSFVEREPELTSLRKDPHYQEVAAATREKK
jgi:serine/threonine-protein kinase